MQTYQPKQFIDGETVETDSEARFDVVNPSTGDVIGDASIASPEDVASALQAARKGFDSWSNTPPFQRAGVLRKAASLMRERQESVAKTLSTEVGKPIGEARAEVAVSAEYFDWFADEAQRLQTQLAPGRAPNANMKVKKEPVGIVLALTAWNFPVSLSARKLATAFAAGCSVILRPADEAPGCVEELVKCCHDAGLPDGAINLLFGPPEVVVAPLMSEPDVRKLSFTGSTRVGQILMRQAADTVKRVTLELGGHAPVVVAEDADLEKAADTLVTAKLRNSGQVCTSPSRFFVHRSLEAEFIEAVVTRMRAIQPGDVADESVTMGPLISERQRERIEGLIENAVGLGARVVCGGNRPKGSNRGYFLEPTLLADIPENADILSDEPFGPIAAVVPFDTLDEVIALANSLEYGLAGYLFTQSNDTANYVSDRLEVGVLGVNTAAVAVPEAPFGGIKQSGFGREGGSEGINDFLNTKFVHSWDL